MLGKVKDLDSDSEFNLDRTGSRQHRPVPIRRRLTGRSSVERISSSLHSLTRQRSVEESDDETIMAAESERFDRQSDLVSQVKHWLMAEKQRLAEKRARRKARTPAQILSGGDGQAETRPRRLSEDSDTGNGSLALEELEQILAQDSGIRERRRTARIVRRGSSRKKLGRGLSTASASDMERPDLELNVPSCDVVLDNSKTLAYSGGEPDDGVSPNRDRKHKSQDVWSSFKYEIVRLTHTLRLRGWRHIPMDYSGVIEVERLSGALTNAVYVLSPPKDLPKREQYGNDSTNSLPSPKKPLPKLLLRIYGPQVEHLIDRDAELSILKRLARKNIGPQLLGTFSNGRFEEYLYARALTPTDLRNPDTSKQIAKRMRELHDGIELLPEERERGPFVWQNWDKWVDSCETIITWLDEQIMNGNPGPQRRKLDSWRSRGLVCGVTWPHFRQTVDRYREWLEIQYGGAGKVRDALVFAHNDVSLLKYFRELR